MKSLYVLRRLWPHVRAHKSALAGIALIGTLASLFECIGIGFVIPLIQSSGNGQLTGLGRIGGILASVLKDVPEQHRVSVAAGIAMSAILLKCILSYGNVVMAANLKSHVGHALRTRIFFQLLNARCDFLDNNDWGAILDGLASSTWHTAQAVGYVTTLMIGILTTIVFAAMLVFVSWKIAALVAVGAVIVFAITHLIGDPVRRSGANAIRKNEKLGCYMLDGIAGMKVIHAYNLQNYIQAKFETASEEVRRAFLGMDVRSALTTPVAEALYAALLLAMLVGASEHQVAMSSVLAAMLILYRLQPQIRECEGARVHLMALSGSIETVASLLDHRNKPRITSGPRRFGALLAGIEFRNVSFRYENCSQEALRRISVSIPRGKTTAIAGPSGSGKTTLLHLICRLYEPGDGEIEVDGTALRELDVSSWRDRIALAGQDIYMFNATVRENIRYGRLDASNEEIVAAAKQAHAHEFITQLPDGYDTAVGDRGARLSGGQRQRISLARAFLRKPDLLILDEATNALDSISEHEIQRAIDEFARTGTVLIVAHRLSTIQKADHIIVLENGEVMEQGRPEALLQNSGLFQKLYTLQALSIGGPAEADNPPPSELPVSAAAHGAPMY